MAGIPGVEWTYLRFIKSENGDWHPAAGTFDGWPETAQEIRVLDPCMGSGHFLVAELPILVAMRMAEEGLTVEEAVVAVLRDNLYGLELDARCTQIAAFNLALAAWKLAGFQKLLPLNLACSGLAPRTKLETWTKLANGNQRLREGMERLYQVFKDGPTLGSLIDPRKFGGDLLSAEFEELQPLLQKALERENERRDETGHELAVTAQGLAHAAEILSDQFTLVATNVPYLGQKKQEDKLKNYCASHHPKAKADLATCFVERCLDFTTFDGSSALVTPQNWLFLGSYKVLREECLKRQRLMFAVWLGSGAFETIGGEVVNVALLCFNNLRPNGKEQACCIDVSENQDPREKLASIISQQPVRVSQTAYLSSPDIRITSEAIECATLLGRYALSPRGVVNGDQELWLRFFSELPAITNRWRWMQSAVLSTITYGGRDRVIDWSTGGRGMLRPGLGNPAYGKLGIAVSRMAELPASLYTGELYDQNTAVLVPTSDRHLLALWAFCTSSDFTALVRKLDKKLGVTPATLLKVPFDLHRWLGVASVDHPKGLPKPFSSNPTQWLFSGHPNGSDYPLQVAVARLLGYRWPRQTGSSFPDCPALGEEGLEKFADSDGIVCISAIKGEEPAAERLRALLAAAYCSEWTAAKQAELLAQVDHAGKSLEDWLRNGFFEQHCALFHHRPFIWHIWDGRKDGFSALVNYHQLSKSNLEKLTYSYLGDWISRQKTAVTAGEAGSDARLQAAKELQQELENILKGEPPYDIFVRWKPIEKQPIGWAPDLNDGIRLNIRPFMSARDVGKRGAGILRAKPNIKWNKDRGTDVTSAPWFKIFKGERINDHHLTLEAKRKARRSIDSNASLHKK
ncbi:MAG: N-6 DNA methylase [Nitrospira sp.]|nr:N-6 DNA methylase [Nitrospira sp.]